MEPPVYRLFPTLIVAASLALGCPSAYDRTYEAEVNRLDAQHQVNRQEALKYVAVVLFAVGSSEIDEAGFKELDWFLQKIAPYGNLDVGVMGYADSTGSEAHNLPLSDERARAVQDYLIARGIPAGRISIGGFGSSDPARENTTSRGRRQNRRAEVRVR